MNTMTKSEKARIVFVALVLGWSWLLPTAQAVLPARGGDYREQEPAASDDGFGLNASTNRRWSFTGSLNTARFYHTATLLPDGRVLVGGGSGNDSVFASAELYDPASETWSVTGSLQTARAAHAATLLPNGMILVEGGYEIHSHFGQTSLSSAELYDPTNGSWTLTSSLGTARCGHTATLLQNGKVLVAGGYNSEHASYLGSAELYDPASGTWTATDSLTTTRASHTATLLQNGMVLVAGGQDFNGSSFASAEVYDPESGTWTATGSLNTGRYLHTATLLPNGMVLVAGGARDHFLPHPFAGAELYDPTSGAWTVTGDLNLARFLHTATLLENGTVLVTGGVSHINASSASVELYDSASGIWRPAASLNTERYLHTATLLSNGKVLVAAGVGYGATVLESAEQSRGHSN